MINHNWVLGQVKFFDPDKGFGFINSILDEQDYFVHISKTKTPISDNDKVVFQLSPSRKKPGTLEAQNVTILSQFKSDIDFLIQQFSQIKDFYFRKAILKTLPSNCITFLVEQELTIPDSLSTEEELTLFNSKVKTINNLFIEVLPKESIESLISSRAEDIASKEFIVQLWLDNIFKSEPDMVLIKTFFEKQKGNSQKIIYQKLTDSTKVSFFLNYVNINNAFLSINNLLIFLQFENNAVIQNKLVYAVIHSIDSAKLDTDESNKVFETISTLNLQIDNSLKNQIISFFYSIAVDYIKLRLWLFGLVDKNDYEVYHANFIFLSLSEQQTFIKKLFFLLSINAQNVSYEKIVSLRNLTYTFNEGKQFQLDFSCNVLLASIETIRSGNFPSEESIFSILTKHVENDSESLLSLNGFFENCWGRNIPDKTEELDDKSKRIITLKTLAIPRNVEFCEGVRFKEDGKDRTYKHDCWWCRGGSCYNANQSSELPKNYNNYSLANFLSILKIPYDQKGYFDFLGLLNKMNVFLKHLKCRSCSNILKPNKEKYYSYYRISSFICSNPQCDNKQSIYLNHCLGARKTAIKSRCDNLIDSRDSVRCNYSKHHPLDKYEQYGPYICNLCGSCCSHKSLLRKYDELIERKWDMQPGLDWKVKNKVGHLERGEIFCYKCGTEMINNEQEYNEFVQKLEHPDGTFRVLKKGTNDYGFWYMIKASEDFFDKARQVGLRVSDTSGDDATIKFISKGNTNFLICQQCNVKYNKARVEFVIEKEEIAD
jgi:cold shock CspA family protein